MDTHPALLHSPEAPSCKSRMSFLAPGWGYRLHMHTFEITDPLPPVGPGTDPVPPEVPDTPIYPPDPSPAGPDTPDPSPPQQPDIDPPVVPETDPKGPETLR